MRHLPSSLAAAAVAALTPGRAVAQDTPADTAPVPFACEERGLADGQPYGCQLLARPTVTRLPAALYWHLAAFPSREAAQVASRFTDVLTEAGGQMWLHRFGPEGDAPTGGTRTARVGPITPPRAAAYQLDVVYEVMPAGARTDAHASPGPVAWFLIEGEQCVETERAAERTREGEGVVGPAAGTARRVVNPGVVARRAFALVVHDPARPRTTPARWRARVAPCAPAS